MSTHSNLSRWLPIARTEQEPHIDTAMEAIGRQRLHWNGDDMLAPPWKPPRPYPHGFSPTALPHGYGLCAKRQQGPSSAARP